MSEFDKGYALGFVVGVLLTVAVLFVLLQVH